MKRGKVKTKFFVVWVGREHRVGFLTCNWCEAARKRYALGWRNRDVLGQTTHVWAADREAARSKT